MSICTLWVCFHKRSWPDAVWCGAGVRSRAQLIIMFSTQGSRRERRAACMRAAADAWSAHSTYDSSTRTYLALSLHIFKQHIWITFGDTGLKPCTLVFPACVFDGFSSCCHFFAKLLLLTWIWKSPRFTMDLRKVILDTHWTFTTQHRTETCKWEFVLII